MMALLQVVIASMMNPGVYHLLLHMMVNDARLIVSQHPGLQLELELMMTIRHDELRLVVGKN
jgi:hypothetical protein